MEMRKFFVGDFSVFRGYDLPFVGLFVNGFRIVMKAKRK